MDGPWQCQHPHPQGPGGPLPHPCRAPGSLADSTAALRDCLSGSKGVSLGLRALQAPTCREERRQAAGCCCCFLSLNPGALLTPPQGTGVIHVKSESSLGGAGLPHSTAGTTREAAWWKHQNSPPPGSRSGCYRDTLGPRMQAPPPPPNCAWHPASVRGEGEVEIHLDRGRGAGQVAGLLQV